MLGGFSIVLQGFSSIVFLTFLDGFSTAVTLVHIKR